MSTIRWTGAAEAVAQVDKFTPANVEVDDVFTLTITAGSGDSHAVSFTATAATVANVTAGLTAAWNADTHELCTPITASDQTTYMDLTADVAGNAFSVAASTTEGGGNDTQTLTRAAVTASAGPKSWDVADNWDTGSLPGGGAGEEVYIEDANDDIIYGLDQSGIANTLASLNIGQSFTGSIGPNGDDGFAGDYLQIKASALNIGYHNGPGTPNGSGRLKIDLGATACAVTIDNAGAATDTAKPAIRLKANSASTHLYIRKGSIGVAFEAGETTTIGNIYVDYVSQITTDANVYVGTGVTMTGLTQKGGRVTVGCALTTAGIYAGTLTTHGSGTVTTYTCLGGLLISNSTGTITTLNISNDAEVDFTRSAVARTVTTLAIDPDGKLKYDPNVIILTNKIVPISNSGTLTFEVS